MAMVLFSWLQSRVSKRPMSSIDDIVDWAESTVNGRVN